MGQRRFGEIVVKKEKGFSVTMLIYACETGRRQSHPWLFFIFGILKFTENGFGLRGLLRADQLCHVLLTVIAVQPMGPWLVNSWTW